MKILRRENIKPVFPVHFAVTALAFAGPSVRRHRFRAHWVTALSMGTQWPLVGSSNRHGRDAFCSMTMTMTHNKPEIMNVTFKL